MRENRVATAALSRSFSAFSLSSNKSFTTDGIVAICLTSGIVILVCVLVIGFFTFFYFAGGYGKRGDGDSFNFGGRIVTI